MARTSRAIAPTNVRRRRLGAELRRLRESMKLSMQDAADVLDKTAQTISNMERGRYGVSKAELEKLLVVYGATQEERETLESLRRDGAKRGWWSTYGLPDWAKPYVGLETDAVAVRNAEPLIIPGLMQTASYAEAIHLVARQATPPEQVAKRVDVRIQRARRLHDAEPLELWAIVGEEALRREVGGAQVMTEQLDHILSLLELPNVTLQVLPLSHGAHPCMAGGLVLLRFADPLDPPLGYLEYPLGAHVVEDDEAVRRLETLFDDLRALALDPRASVRLITTIRDEYRRRTGGS
ncbi:helix-turn-helix domain-containing protein [Streptoalloteichus tenebrarius]|nr:helix-turn-helix transcriptional regulator [Streptoalloteichus tenebrarius]